MKRTQQYLITKMVNLFQGKTKSLIFIILAILTSSSCSHPDKKVFFQFNTNQIKKNDTTDLFVALIGLTKQLNMPLLQNGVDSFEIRIWCPLKNGNLHSEQNIISVKYIDKAWTITQTRLWEKIPEYIFKRNDTINHLLDIKVDSSSTTQLFPSSGIKSFIDSLSSFDILNVPTQDSINKTISPYQDGYRYIFEMATRDSYRMIEYNCGEVEGLEDFHKKIGRFLDFLKNQLNVKILHCNHSTAYNIRLLCKAVLRVLPYFLI